MTASPPEPNAARSLDWVSRGSALMPAFVRRFVRSREIGLTLFAALVGALAAVFVAAMGALAARAHIVLFNLQPGERLSDVPRFDNPFVPMLGGVLLCAMTWLGARVGRTSVVDPIEANALRGGRMSVRDSALLALQTLISNGFGASVGLEAGYTQIASGVASRAGSWMQLRREDMRVIVASGAAGAIAAAFNGPLTGAFYAFELVLAQNAIGYVAPVMAASICATLATHALGGAPFALQISATREVTAWDFPWFLLLGISCGIVGIIWMRSLPLAERLFTLTRAPRMIHPIIGGLLVGEIATFDPKILSSGHGALEFELFVGMGLAGVLMLAALKMLASTLSLGAGFRGGLFFASLLVGALIGRAVALEVTQIWPQVQPDPIAFALVGMGALAAAIIGTPLTMSFLVLETTSDYGLTAAVLTASVASNLVAREFFGYSFSTWRFHLRGETVRSARDIGWVRELTVARLMRTDPAVAPAEISIQDFRRSFPLGSRQRVVLIDAERRVRGIVAVANAHVESVDADASALSIAKEADKTLLPDMSVKDAMRAFDEAESDTLAVVDNLEDSRLIGTLNETYIARRYADEMERAQAL